MLKTVRVTNSQYNTIVNLLLDKVGGRECLYKSASRQPCLSTNIFPERITDERPVGWCEICWLTYQLEDAKKINTKLIKELNKQQSISTKNNNIHSGQLVLDFEFEK